VPSSSHAPLREPIGLEVTRTSKVLGRAFDEALASVGGTLPTWLVLVSLKAQRHARQRDLAEAVGIEGPTLTHHLNRMEDAGLVTRTRDPRNRRVHQVALTDAGEAAFERMRQTVAAFDRRLRTGLADEEVDQLGRLLAQLRENATGSEKRPS
jgi:MarR family transcriptional regulator for hemolysin